MRTETSIRMHRDGSHAHQVAGFLGTWLGATSSSGPAATTDSGTSTGLLAIGAALIHIPIKQVPKLRPEFTT